MNNIDSENNKDTDNNINSSSYSFFNNNIKEYSHSDKKSLSNRINNIKNKKCYIKIFSLLHNSNINYTKNDNGIFFNISILSNDILSIIDNIISYYENK